MTIRRARYRVTDVAASEATPTGRLVGVDEEGREVSLELPVAWIRGTELGARLVIELQIEKQE